MAQTGGRLVEGAPELGGQQLALFGGDGALLLQVQLVRDQDQRNVLGEANARDELPIFADLLEAPAIRHRVADHESFAAAHVLVPHGCELHLAGRVQNIQERCLSIDHRLLLICILCGGAGWNKEIFIMGLKGSGCGQR